MTCGQILKKSHSRDGRSPKKKDSLLVCPLMRCAFTCACSVKLLGTFPEVTDINAAYLRRAAALLANRHTHLCYSHIRLACSKIGMKMNDASAKTHLFCSIMLLPMETTLEAPKAADKTKMWPRLSVRRKTAEDPLRIYRFVHMSLNELVSLEHLLFGYMARVCGLKASILLLLKKRGKGMARSSPPSL